MNPLAIFQPKHQRQQDIKARIVKNEEVILEAMGKRARGAKTCPFYLGATCVADACEFFIELKSVSYICLAHPQALIIDNKCSQCSEQAITKEFEFRRCSFVETPLLLIELNQNIRRLTDLLTKEKANEKMA